MNFGELCVALLIEKQSCKASTKDATINKLPQIRQKITLRFKWL